MATQDSKIPDGFCQCGCRSKTKEKSYWPHTFNNFIHGHNAKAEKNNNWKGGKIASFGTYNKLYVPGHPRSNQNRVLEHIIIAEKSLGKALPLEAEVHHHDKTHLVICQDRAYHMLLHQRMRAIKACGHASWRKCQYCKQWDDPKNLYIKCHLVAHKSCVNYHRNLLRNLGKVRK